MGREGCCAIEGFHREIKNTALEGMKERSGYIPTSSSKRPVFRASSSSVLLTSPEGLLFTQSVHDEIVFIYLSY